MQPFYDRRRVFAGVLDIIKKFYTVPFIKKIFPKLTTFKYINKSNSEVGIVVNSAKESKLKKIKIRYVYDTPTYYSYIDVYYDYIVDSEGRPVPKDMAEFNRDLSEGIYFNSIKHTFTDKTTRWQQGTYYSFGNTATYSGVRYVYIKMRGVGRPDIATYAWKQTTLPYFEFDVFVGDESNFVAYSLCEDRVANYTEEVESDYKINKSVNIELKNVTELNGYIDPPYMMLSETTDEETHELSGNAVLSCPDGYTYKTPKYYSPFSGYNDIKSLKISKELKGINIEKTFYGLFRWVGEYSPLGLNGNCELDGIGVIGFNNCLELVVDPESTYFASKLENEENSNGILYKYNENLSYTAYEKALDEISYVLPKCRENAIERLSNGELGDIFRIGHSAFGYLNSNITSNTLHLPISIGSVERYAFINYDNLKNLYIDTNMERYKYTTKEITLQEVISSTNPPTIAYYTYSLNGLTYSCFEEISTNRKAFTPDNEQNGGADVYVKFVNGDQSFTVRGIIKTFNASTSYAFKSADLYLYEGTPFFTSTPQSLEHGIMSCVCNRNNGKLSIRTNATNIPEGTKVYFSYYDAFYMIGNQDIYPFAFAGCPIEKIVINGFTNYRWGYVGLNYIDDGGYTIYINDSRWLVNNTLKTVVIGCEDDITNKVKTKSYVIPQYAFADCINLKTVIANNFLQEIQAYAFSDCENLSYFNFNDEDSTVDVRNLSIKTCAFKNCKKVRTNEDENIREFRLPKRLGGDGWANWTVWLSPSAFKSCGEFDLFSTYTAGAGLNANTTSRYIDKKYRIFFDTKVKELHINGPTYDWYFNIEQDCYDSLRVIKINVEENSRVGSIRSYEFRVFNQELSSGDTEREKHCGYNNYSISNSESYPLQGFYNLEELYFYGALTEIEEWTFYGCPLKKVVIDVDNDKFTLGDNSMSFHRYDYPPYLQDSVIDDFYLYNEIDRTLPVWVSFKADRTYYVSTGWGYQIYTGDTFSRSTQYWYWDGAHYHKEGSPSNDMDIYTYDTVTEEYVLYTSSRIPRPTSGTDYYYYIPSYAPHSFLSGRRIENLYFKNSLKRNLWLEAISTNVYYINEEHYPENPHYQT